jgi:transcriptional regulator with XRE-family HTH domain
MTISPAPLGGRDERFEFDLADRLRRALRVSGISSNEIADYLGVSRTSVSNWINGRIEPSTQTLRLFALRTGFPYEWLRDGAELCTPSDLNREPTDSGWGALATVVDIDTARSLRTPAVPLDAA